MVGNVKQETLNGTQVTVTEVELDKVDLKMSISPQMQRSSGFVRRGGVPYFETIDGKQETDPHLMRRYCLCLDEHRERINQLTGRRVVAVISAGNYGPNSEYIVLLNDEENEYPDLQSKPILFRRRDEDQRILKGRSYYAFIVWKDGRLTAERVKFALNDGNNNQGRVFMNRVDITDNVNYAFTGPPLVWDGRALSPSETASCWSCDIRHLIYAVMVPLSNGEKIVLGEAELTSDETKLQDAVDGKIVNVGLPPGVPINEARRALKGRGYEEVSNEDGLKIRGQFYVPPFSDQIQIRFKEGVYPHNVLGYNPDENTLINIQVDGRSGYTGCTISEMAQLLLKFGAKCGIGLDQGMDPHLMAGDFLKTSLYGERWRISAAIVLVLKASYEKVIEQGKPLVWTPHMSAQATASVAYNFSMSETAEKPIG